MNNIEFFKSLNYENGLSVVKGIFKRFPLQYGTTLGLDGKPQIRPLEFKFEEDGVLYFDTVSTYDSYMEMQQFPYIQICIGDQDSMSYIRVEGKVNFTNEKDVIGRCFDNSPVLTSQFGDDREKVVGYYLTAVNVEFRSFDKELGNHDYKLMNKFDLSA